MHAHTHTCMHAHTRVHARTHTHAHARTHTHAHTHTHTCLHTCMHAYTNAHTLPVCHFNTYQYCYIVSNWIREGAVASHEKIVSAQKALQILWMIS